MISCIQMHRQLLPQLRLQAAATVLLPIPQRGFIGRKERQRQKPPRSKLPNGTQLRPHWTSKRSAWATLDGCSGTGVRDPAASSRSRTPGFAPGGLAARRRRTTGAHAAEKVWWVASRRSAGTADWTSARTPASGQTRACAPTAPTAAARGRTVTPYSGTGRCATGRRVRSHP